MANFEYITMTNYFRVVDEMAFRTLLSRVKAEDSVYVWDNVEGHCTQAPKEEKMFAFGIYGGFNLVSNDSHDPEDPMGWLEADELYNELRALLPDGEAVIATTIASERPRHLTSHVTVVTNQKVISECVDMFGVAIAREMLGCPQWVTKHNH